MMDSPLHDYYHISNRINKKSDCFRSGLIKALHVFSRVLQAPRMYAGQLATTSTNRTIWTDSTYRRFSAAGSLHFLLWSFFVM